jgi:hypothetical protein
MAKTEAPEMNELLVQTIAQQTAILAKLGENTKPYEPAFGDPAYQARLHEEGHFDTFPTPVFQNGRECEAKGLPADIREKASALESGTFLNGKVTVDRSDRAVHLKYKAATVEDRMRSSSWWRDFPDLITQLWNEQHPA